MIVFSIIWFVIVASVILMKSLISDIFNKLGFGC